MSLSPNFIVRKTNKDCIVYRNDLKDAISIFNNIFDHYLKLNNKYSFKIYSINSHERVVIFEENIIIYAGLKYHERPMPYQHIRTVYDNYTIVFQELLSDTFFKFNKTSFLKYYLTNYKYENRMDIKYKVFNGNIQDYVWKNYQGTFDIYESNFDYVNNYLPQLSLLDRYNNWKGWLYYFIVYETNYNSNKGYFMIHTQNTNPYKYAHSFEKHVENEMKMAKYYYGQNPFDESGNFYSIKESFNKAFLNSFEKYYLDENGKCNTNVKTIGDYSYYLNNNLKYFVVPIYIKQKDNLYKYQIEIFNNVINGEYNNYEKHLFKAKNYAWKSEMLMLECIKKVFKNHTIIHQYSPYFLGQMSYDVYVCGKKIAFEYQGKQHFEAIDFFGGEESFKKQVYRDKRKKELSEQNGIKLIYVNYWEDITVNLIKSKITDYDNSQ